MSFTDDLKHIKEIKKKIKCVSYAYYNEIVYYSINGVNAEKDKPKFIEDMYSTKIKIQCKFEHAYTVINPKTFGHYIMFPDYDNRLLNRLEKKQSIFIEDIIEPKKIDFNYDNRNWSCCERKIIGYLFEKEKISLFNHKIKLYVLERPCLLCVPMVTEAVYLNENGYINHVFYSKEKVAHNTMRIDSK